MVFNQIKVVFTILFILIIGFDSDACVSAYTNSVELKIVSKSAEGYQLLIASEPVLNGTNKKAGPTTYKFFKEDDGFLLLKLLAKKAGEKASSQERELAIDVAKFYISKLQANKMHYINKGYFKGSSEDFDDTVRELSQQSTNLSGTPNLRKTINSLFTVAGTIEKDLKKYTGGHAYKGTDGKAITLSDIYPEQIARGIGCSATKLKVNVPKEIFQQVKGRAGTKNNNIHKVSH